MSYTHKLIDGVNSEKYKKANEFKKEIIATCKKYDFSISHEDGHGGFIITDYDDFYSDWFNEARIDND